jgi:cystathionine gamma-synthase
MTHFETRAVHVGQEPDAATGAVIPPVYLTSTHRQNGVGNLPNGYEYNRGGNPSRDALQETLANLEGGRFGYSFASGLAAEDAIIRAIVKPGDHVILADDLYGGTFRLFNRIHRGWGIDLDVVDLNDPAAIKAAIRPGKTKMIWIETPSNPMLTVFDITAVSALAHAEGLLTVVDNTFATPYLQRPLELGADIVVHSTTKYLGGHSDILGGAVILNDGELAEKIGFLQFAAGAVSGAFDSWLTSRSLKTLALRMERHCQNAMVIAKFLDVHPAIETVYYPGLDSHPTHAIAARQMSGFGGIVSVKVKGGTEAAKKFAESTKIFTLAESLGGVESLVNHPAEMTHASAAGTPIEVSGDIVRLSVGVEHIDDLVADLTQALDNL